MHARYAGLRGELILVLFEFPHRARVLGHAATHTPRSAGGDDRISQVPAQTPLPPRSCSRDPGRTERNLPCRSAQLGHGYRNARDFFDYTFEAQLHGLMARCLRFKAPGRPGTMQDSLPIARLRSIGWVSHPQGLL